MIWDVEGKAFRFEPWKWHLALCMCKLVDEITHFYHLHTVLIGLTFSFLRNDTYPLVGSKYVFI